MTTYDPRKHAEIKRRIARRLNAPPTWFSDETKQLYAVTAENLEAEALHLDELADEHDKRRQDSGRRSA
jgi:hypothetical protein